MQKLNKCRNLTNLYWFNNIFNQKDGLQLKKNGIELREEGVGQAGDLVGGQGHVNFQELLKQEIVKIIKKEIENNADLF